MYNINLIKNVLLYKLLKRLIRLATLFSTIIIIILSVFHRIVVNKPIS